MAISIRKHVLVLLAAVCLLQGCAIGVSKYTGADIPPKSVLSTLKDVPIYVVECPTGKDSFGMITKVHGVSPGDFLASEYGLKLKQGRPSSGEQAIYVQITPDGFDEPLWGIVSGLIHFFSFSIVPGYWTSTYYFEIQIVFTKPDGRSEVQSFKSQFNKQLYLWLPLVVASDTIFTIGAGIDTSIEKLLEAKKGIAGAIALEIQKQYEAAGGVGGWRTENLDSAAYCSK